MNKNVKLLIFTIIIAINANIYSQKKLDNYYSFIEGVNIFKSKNYTFAKKLFKQLYEQGNNYSCFYLGTISEFGLVDKRSYNKARFYYEILSKTSHVEIVVTDINKNKIQLKNSLYDQIYYMTKYRLAYLYWYGLGGPQKQNIALELYKIAANHGIIDAQIDLGTIYMNGEYVKQDFATAEKYFLSASHNKKMFNIASLQLAILYFKQYKNNNNEKFLNKTLYYLDKAKNIKFDKAYSLICKSLKKTSNNTEFLDKLSWTLYKAKQYKKAIEFSEKALKEDMFNITYIYHYGKELEAIGENFKSCQKWQVISFLAEISKKKLSKEEQEMVNEARLKLKRRKESGVEPILEF